MRYATGSSCPYGFDPCRTGLTADAPLGSLRDFPARSQEAQREAAQDQAMAARDTPSADGRPHHHPIRTSRLAIPAVDIALPVHNEERLHRPPGVERSYDHLTEHFPYSWQITIAENGSTDGTRLIGQRLASELREVRVRLDEAGAVAAAALRRVWSESGRRCWPTWTSTSRPTSPLTRARRAAHVGRRRHRDPGHASHPSRSCRRSPRREVLSRGYMAVLRAAFRPLSATQCG